MKKILLTTMLMLAGIAAWAQNWTAPSANDYESSTPVYVQLNVNGAEQLKAEIAAFIDGDCRAVAYGAETVINNSQYYQLRVWGNPSDDYNKTITFKAVWEGLVFSFKKTIPWTGETHTEIPVVLNVDMPTGVVITNPLEIKTKLPGTYDLNNDITFSYEGRDVDGSTIDYTPLNESTIETLLTYEWDFANSSSYFTVDGKNILTALQETGEAGMYLSLTVTDGNTFRIGGWTNVIITTPKVAVENISCTPTAWTININDNLKENQDLAAAITVLPEDASDKTYTFVPADAAAEAVYNNGFFSATGTYNINIVSNSDRGIYTTIAVTVVKSVESISINSPSGRFYAVAGDNVFDMISPYVSVYPSDATNQNFSFVVPAEASDAIVDGVAGRMPGLYYIDIVAEENPQIKTQVEVVINDIMAPAEITLNIGDTYSAALDGKIRVLPMLEAESFTYTVAPKTNADAEGFDVNGAAAKSGTYTLLVTCDQNPKATAEITVTVVTPVVITFPAKIILSKFKDTDLELTFVEGDNFDPSLIELRFTGNLDMPGITEPITYTPVANSNNLKWKLRGYRVGYYWLEVFYNGVAMLNTEKVESSDVRLPVEIPFNNNGWDWIYYPANYPLISYEEGSYLPWLNQDANNRIIDLRSQTELLYNDDTYGLFGTINHLSSGEGMYKVKAKYEDAADAMFVASENDDYYWDSGSNKPIYKGYNWIGYTNEWDITFAEFNTINEYNRASDGDMIIGKNGFAEYDATYGGWIEQNGFILQAGKGYIYYSTSEDEKYVNFEVYPSLEESNAKQRVARQRTSVWHYDAGAFADNMAMVAEISNLNNPEDYTIGAFVDGECRGEGSFVAGNKMMISVAGKTGEEVSFRLYNHITGEYSEIFETVKYGQKLGSLKKPVALTSPETTGIKENYEFGNMNTESQVFDMNGRRVGTMSKSGVYVIKTVENGKVVTKKVVKK